MRLIETSLAGAFIVEVERLDDERGFFARTFCAEIFAARGLEARLGVQCNISYNSRRNTLRGMHWQAAPHAEAKLVRCTAGSLLDVIVDLRPASATYLQHVAVELSASSRSALYIPPDFAHGFLTLEDETEVFYQMSEVFQPASARGARYDDPAFEIAWPDLTGRRIISDSDLAYEPFVPQGEHG